MSTTLGTESAYGQSRGLNGYYRDAFGLPPSGSGKHRSYTEADVRLAVSYCQWMELVGNLNEEAVHLMALYDYGWVISSSIGVWWTPMPSPQVFDGGAICVPIPEWNPVVVSGLL
jgi:hypothetical protein